LAMLEVAWDFLADMDAASMPASALAGCLQVMGHTDGVQAVAGGQLLAAFDVPDGSLVDGQPATRAWLVKVTRVRKGQAAEYRGLQGLAEKRRPLRAGMRERAVTKSQALQRARWTARVPGEYRPEAEQIVVAAARAGADVRALAAIIAGIQAGTAAPESGGPGVGRGVFLAAALDGAGCCAVT
jgi:hypothetical protein